MDNREIDRLITNEVIKHVLLTTAWNPIDSIYGTLPHYSTSISDVWKVVEKLETMGDFLIAKDFNENEWEAELTVYMKWLYDSLNNKGRF